MNKRFLSTLLTGVMLLAATSMFVSCKDYDDDIKNLQTQIDKAALQSSVDALRTELTSQLTSAQASLQSAINAKADASDLAKLAERVAAIETKLATLDDYAKKADVESLATAIAVLTGDLTELEKAYKAADQSLSDELAAEKAAREAVEANLKLQSDALEALKAEVAKLTTAVGDNKTAIEKLQKAVEEIQNKLNDFALKTDVEALKKQMNELSKLIDANAADINVLSVLVNKRLTSLVFDPQFYWGGIESMEAAQLAYQPITYTKPYDAKKTLNVVFNEEGRAAFTGQAIEFARGDKDNTYNLPIEAQYYMNPSTASIDYITGVSVISGDKDAYTRGAACGPSVKSYSAKDGLLTTKIAVADWKKICDQANNKVTVVAVQATVKGEKNDTTVTSDFAAIAPSLIRGFKIVDNDPSNVQSNCNIYGRNEWRFHIYPVEEMAIERAFTHQLVWNDKDGIDLDEVIEVHAQRTLNLNNTQQNWSEFKLEDLKERYGFELKYELVSYTSGENKTEQSLTHATLDGSILKATGINGEQTKASIGREPLVKVELIDTNNKNAIVDLGFIKFQIVGDKAPDVTINTYEHTAYWLCGGTNKDLKWSDIETDILANNEIVKNGLSKSTFESIYGVTVWDQPDVATPELKRLGTNVGGLTYVLIGDQWINCFWAGLGEINGIISFKSNNVTDHQTQETNILGVKLTEHQINYLLAKRSGDDQKPYLMADGKTKTANLEEADTYDTMTLTVAIRLADIDNSGYPDIYIPFKLTVSKLQISLNKIPEYWYAENSAAAKSGFNEIHVNVDVIGQPNADVANFQGDFLSTVFQNTLQLAAKPAQDAVVGETQGYIQATGTTISEADRTQITTDGGLNTQLYFKPGETKAKIDGNDEYGTIMTGMTGAKYFVYPSAYNVLSAYAWDANNNQVTGAAQELVRITNDATTYNFVVYDDADELTNNGHSYVEDLINYASHKDLANTLTASVGIRVNEGECGAPVILTNPDFDVKFLRPVDVDGSASKEFTDAVDGGNKLDILELIKPIDWRDKWDDMTWVKNGNNQYTKEGAYFKYYNVLSIVPNTKGITTNMGGGTLGETLLSSVSQQVKVVWSKDADKLAELGITLDDNKATHLVGPKAEPWDKGEYGFLLYVNNNNTVTEFTIRVPLTIGYYWGSTTSYVDIKVKNTLNN